MGNKAGKQEMVISGPMMSSRDGSVRGFAKAAGAGQVVEHGGRHNQEEGDNRFMNVTIQALWHLGPFRIEVQKLILSKDSQTGELLTAIAEIFCQNEFSEQSMIPPTELRDILIMLSEKFDLGEIADSNEALDAILGRIHDESTPVCSGPHPCLSHKVFGGCVTEQVVCKCRATNEPIQRSDFLQYVHAHECIEYSQQMGFRGSFGTLVRRCIEENSRDCPSSGTDGGCGNRASLKAFATDPPLALGLNIGNTALSSE
jgi:hypothetical protein